MNIKKRMEAKNEFEKNFKLMINCFWKNNGKLEKA